MHVLTDSSCDLPPDLVDRFGLHIIPILITLDGRSYRDGVDLSRDEFYRQLPALKNLPTTAAPSLSLIHEISIGQVRSKYDDLFERNLDLLPRAQRERIDAVLLGNDPAV